MWARLIFRFVFLVLVANYVGGHTINTRICKAGEVYGSGHEKKCQGLTTTWEIEYEYAFVDEVDCYGHDIKSLPGVSLPICLKSCNYDSNCKSVQYNTKNTCYLKNYKCKLWELKANKAGRTYNKKTIEEDYIKLYDVDCNGHDIKKLPGVSLKECLKSCNDNSACLTVQYNTHGNCYLKNHKCRQWELKVNNTGRMYNKKQGCRCKTHYYRTTAGACVCATKCPCYDKYGNPRQVNTTWLSSDCTEVKTCKKGQKGPYVENKSWKCQSNQVCKVKADKTGECVLKPCSGGSTYHPLVSPCKDFCTNPNFSHVCRARLGPGCKCPAHQLWDLSDSNNHKCVDAKSCGCYFTHDGEKHHIKHLDHWVSKGCKDKFKCLFELNRPKLYHMEPYRCPENGHCCCKEGCKCICKHGYQMMMHEHKCVKIHRNPVAIIYQPVAVYELKKAPDGSCAPLSIKTDHASPCPDTCANPWASTGCKDHSRPGCQCHTGHLFDHEIQLCIPQETCKCYDNDEVGHEVGSSWLNDLCTIMYMCTTNNDGKTEIRKVYYTCPKNSTCKKHQGKDHGHDHKHSHGHHGSHGKHESKEKIYYADYYECACNHGYERAADGTCECQTKRYGHGGGRG